jgi:ATP-binding cassette subfamily B protein
MKLFWQYLKNYKGLLLVALFLALINRVFSLLDPQIFRMIIDGYASRITELASADFLYGVGWLLVAAVGVALVSRIAKNFQDYYVSLISQKLGAKLYADSVAHSFSLPYFDFEDQRSGELLQKLNKARQDAEKLIHSLIDILFFSLIGITFVLIYAFFVHWSLGLTFTMIIPTLSLATFAISKKIKTAQAEVVKEKADLAGSTTETIRNVELVKSLGLEQQEVNRLNEVNEKILKLELKKIRLVRTMSFIQGTLINLLRSAMLLLMLWLIYIKIITLGEYFTLLFYSFLVFTPLTDFGQLATEYREAEASSEMLQTILRRPPEVKPVNPTPLTQLQYISFSDVNFSYQSISEPSVKNINFKISAGQTVAFVGPSGSGKTTLIKLLVGLYKPTSGKIFYNNIFYNNIDFTKLRQRIGLVSQDTQLFAGSIRDNLLFVNPQATDNDCLLALRQSAAENIIMRGDKGLDTKIGEGGIKLSGGEKQRLAIARALLRQPELIIFDEATSSLDSITEASITETIKQVERANPNLIRILVAHRLSTVKHADTIYVLEKGQIIEQDSHINLLQKGGLYAALWRQQSIKIN